MEKLIVTRHPALIDYLLEKGISGRIIEHATPENVTNRDVYGVLPHHLSCFCNTFTEIPIHIPAELRGKELTLEDIKKYAKPMVTYKVRRI